MNNKLVGVQASGISGSVAPVNFTQITNSGFFDASGDVVKVTEVTELQGQAIVLTSSPNRVHWRTSPTGNWNSFDYNSAQAYCLTYFNGNYIRGGQGGGISATRHSSTINSSGSAGSGNADDTFYEFIIVGSNLFATGRNVNGHAAIYKSTNGTSWSQVYTSNNFTFFTCVTKQLVSGVWHLWLGDTAGNIQRFNTNTNAIIDTIDCTDQNINPNAPVVDIIYVPNWDMVVALCGAYLWATPTTTIWRGMARSTDPFYPSYDYYFQTWNGIDGGKGGNKPLALDAAGALLCVGYSSAATSGMAFYRQTTAPTLREIFLGTYYGNQWTMVLPSNKPTVTWYTQRVSHYCRYFETLGWIVVFTGFQSGTTSKGFGYTTYTTIS